MSGQAPQRSNPERSARPRVPLAQKKPIRKLSGRAVQTRQTLPASRVIVTIQEDPSAHGLANVQIMRRVARTSNSASTPGPTEGSSTNWLYDFLNAILSGRTPEQRLEQAREEQRKFKDVIEKKEEEDKEEDQEESESK